jgi:hypothetical protein
MNAEGSEARSTDPPDERFDLGVLFVHGIGDQPRGSTLVDFGTPIADWLMERASALDCHVEIAKAHITSPEGLPPHSKVTIEGPELSRRWLFAESWWASSFRTPRFRDLAGWGLKVAPWTLGTHFASRLVRAWQKPASGILQKSGKAISIAKAFVSVIGGLLLSTAVVALFAALLVVRLIPWKRLRDAAAAVQVRIASSLGDAYAIIARPIEESAILTKVTEDFDWLHERCERIAVLAHSQGAALGARVLASRTYTRDEDRPCLITFGSGVRKLEEQRELRRNPHDIRGAGLSVLGLVVATLVLLLLPGTLHRVMIGQASVGSVVIVLIYAIVGLALLGGGIRDFVASRAVAGIHKLRADLQSKGVRWKDYYAEMDPVPNGAMDADGELPPASECVVNVGSVIRDHNSYWTNRDEFVTLVADALLDYAQIPKLRLSAADIETLRIRRKRRVKLLQLVWWITIGAVVVLVVQHYNDWIAILSSTITRASESVVDLIGYDAIGRSPWPEAPIWGRSLGLVAAVLAGYAFVLGAWEAWNRNEMEKLPPKTYEGLAPYIFAVTLTYHLVAMIGIVFSRAPSATIFAAALFTAVAVTLFADTAGKRQTQKSVGATLQSTPERTLSVLSGMLKIGALIFSGFAVYAGLSSLISRLPIWGQWIASSTLIAIVLLFIVGIAVSWRRERRSRASAPERP